MLWKLSLRLEVRFFVWVLLDVDDVDSFQVSSLDLERDLEFPFVTEYLPFFGVYFFFFMDLFLLGVYWFSFWC